MKSWKFILLAVALFSCDNGSPQKIMEFVHNPDNGLVQEQTISGMTCRIRLFNADAILAREVLNKSLIKEDIDQRRSELTGNYRLHIEILSVRKEDKLAEYLPGQFQQDISIHFDGDSIPASLYHYEGYNQISGFYSVLTGFSAQDEHWFYNHSDLRIALRGLPGGASFRFNIPITSVKEIPQLNL